MKKEEYKVMFNIEDNYWWYVGLRKLVLAFIDGISTGTDNLEILDAGCGTGKILEECKEYKSYGIDFSEEALKFCKLRDLNNLLKASVSEIPFRNNSFDIVISLDVLYHKNVGNEEETLKGLYQVMNKGGRLLLNLPAYDFIQSRHDRAVHTKRRYTCKYLKEKLEKAGFNIETITYRNSILFPIAVIKRMVDRFFFFEEADAESDLVVLPCWINKLFTKILIFENKLIRSGMKFPFGLSIFCVAIKRSG